MLLTVFWVSHPITPSNTTGVDVTRGISLLCCESKDLTKKKQLNIVVRYEKDNFPTKQLLDILPAEGLTAADFAVVVMKTLCRHKIDMKG